jgi:hypothetical protein
MCRCLPSSLSDLPARSGPIWAVGARVMVAVVAFGQTWAPSR